jgi:hypothetical protein
LIAAVKDEKKVCVKHWQSARKNEKHLDAQKKISENLRKSREKKLFYSQKNKKRKEK